MLNVLDTIGKQYACTSVAASNQAGDMIRSRSLDYRDLEYLKPLISKRRDNKGNTENIHSAVFNSNTLDFWIAVDPPRASMGKWVGFNLACELDQKGCGPDLAVVSPQ